MASITKQSPILQGENLYKERKQDILYRLAKKKKIMEPSSIFIIASEHTGIFSRNQYHSRRHFKSFYKLDKIYLDDKNMTKIYLLL